MAKEEKKKTKRPTAQKREIRNSKRRLINKVFKSQVRTAMRSFEEALKGNDKEKIQQSLNAVYSMMDKGVKRGIYKHNKAARVKARSTQRVFALSV
ncbi:MAG: 30S ribosomal protein S20 [Chlamydiales bacterium]|nr:30S ribosomal protein S20 [Chlamydiales bacterium]